MGTTDMSRYRFSVPVQDTMVHDWVHSQSNLSFSLRVLIKAFVNEYGNQDATCLELGSAPKKRGRPSNSMKQQLEQMSEKGEPVIERESAPVEKEEPAQPVQQAKPPEKTVQTPTEVKTDDDGFVDPESLLN